MASQYNFIANITASKDIREKLTNWANDNISNDEEARLARLCDDADYNFMGFLPFVIDNTLEGNPEKFAWRSFCDGASDDGNMVRLCFHAIEDACCDMWEYITERYSDIETVRVYVNPEFEYDIDELGEDDIFSYDIHEPLVDNVT